MKVLVLTSSLMLISFNIFSQVSSLEDLNAVQHLPMSIEKPADADGIFAIYPNNAPPLFLAISNNDILVTSNSSSQLYELWHRAEKPVELHVFGNGDHGFGAKKDGALTDAWMELFKNWMEAVLGK